MLSEDYVPEIGRWLRSDAVGAQGEFIGEVVRVRDGAIYLRDGEGRVWARERETLSPINQRQRPAAKA